LKVLQGECTEANCINKHQKMYQIVSPNEEEINTKWMRRKGCSKVGVGRLLEGRSLQNRTRLRLRPQRPGRRYMGILEKSLPEARETVECSREGGSGWIL
jgi:hypothetical protein